MRRAIAVGSVLAMVVGSFAIGCADMTPTQQSTLSGGAIGAAGGALIGAASGHAAAGAAIGGAAGATGGYLYEKSREQNRYYQDQNRSYQDGPNRDYEDRSPYDQAPNRY
jgi:osmotically inducible lipoprotein OsmB